jgi:hypothetical protein
MNKLDYVQTSNFSALLEHSALFLAEVARHGQDSIDNWALSLPFSKEFAVAHDLCDDILCVEGLLVLG